jgi:hypothetical protein
LVKETLERRYQTSGKFSFLEFVNKINERSPELAEVLTANMNNLVDSSAVCTIKEKGADFSAPFIL